MNKLYLILAFAVLPTVSLAAYSFAKPQNQTNSENLSVQQDRAVAVGVVRTLNTAEAGYRFKPENGSTKPRNHYATWAELFSSGIFDEMKPPSDVASLLNANGVQGFKLALIVSPDGGSYQLALHDAKRENALFSVFSDQSGIIYTGSPLE